MGAVLAVGVGATVGAVAVGPNTPTIYYACVSNTTGAIHMSSAEATCSTGTHKIQWNSQGPAAAGASHVYQASSFYVRVGPRQRRVLDVRVPAGTYTVTAKLAPFATGTNVHGLFQCTMLEPDGGGVDQSFSTVDTGTDGFSFNNMTLIAAFTTSGGLIRVVCSDSGAAGQLAQNRVVAVSAGTLNP